MTDRPIIFSAPMVNALLEGRKTQTRRVLTDAPIGEEWCRDEDYMMSGLCLFTNGNGPSRPCQVPYAVGDRMYVRETWGCHWATDGEKPSEIDRSFWSVYYFADNYMRPPKIGGDRASPGQVLRKRVAIHMPRWASRLTLLVTDVRVQRVNDISCADAIAEGILPSADSVTIDCDTPDPRHEFRDLWNSLHAKPPKRWEDNPWVVAVSFDVQRGNIDDVA